MNVRVDILDDGPGAGCRYYASSPQIAGWTTAGETLDELHAMIAEGVEFAFPGQGAVSVITGPTVVPAAA